MEAERLEREAIEDFGRQGDPRMEGAARTYLAEILIAAGDYAGAEREAATAIATLDGAPSLQVAALGVSSRARLGRGDAEGALEAGRAAHEALERLGEIEEGESMVRLAFAEALEQTGARDEARRALAAAHRRLLARAERIEEPAWRNRFLHTVPVNARILALAEEWRAPAAQALAGAEPAAAVDAGPPVSRGARAPARTRSPRRARRAAAVIVSGRGDRDCRRGDSGR